MDTANASLISQAPVTMAPSPSASEAMPTARPDGPRPNRSFAATLANEQQPAGHGVGKPVARGAEESGAAPQGGAPATPDAAPKDAKPATKTEERRRTDDGGNGPPPDGNALPPWLPPVAVPIPAITVTAAAVLAVADTPSAITAPDASAFAASQAQGGSTGQLAPTAGQQVEAAAASIAAASPSSTATATAAVVTSPAGDAASPQLASTAAATDTASLAAALEKSAASPASAPAQGAAARVPGAADGHQPAAAPTTAPPPAAPSPPTQAIAQAAAATTSPSPVVSVIVAPPAPKATRAPGAATGVDRVRNAAPAADVTSDTPPVATELKHAVVAALAADAGTDVTAGTAAQKLTTDATAGVVPQMPAPERAAAPIVTQMTAPVGTPDWAHELGDRVSVLVNQNLTHAQIKLSPPDLGPIEVRIQLADGQANVSFTTHSHLTSEALQAAAPRLREALGAQGYSSVNVDVAQQQFRERQPQQLRYEPEPSFAVAAPTGAAHAAARVAGNAGGALRLDAYA